MKKIKSFNAGQYFSMYGRVFPASLLVGVPVGFVHGWFSFIIIMLYEGFTRYSAANACLSRILAMNPAPDDKLLHWTTSLQEEIPERIRERAELHE